MRYKIAIASDHAGYLLKEEVKKYLDTQNISYEDFGPDNPDPVDYPDFGLKVSKVVSKGEFERGILVCGSGIGMSMVANKVRGIRAALCFEPTQAKMSRLHNDSNILVLAGKFTGILLAEAIVRVWLETPFSNEERHKIRINKIMDIEK